VVPLKQHNTQSRITLEILKQCSSNLAPVMYITKETYMGIFGFSQKETGAKSVAMAAT